jgi:signal transduction histidine kinase
MEYNDLISKQKEFISTISHEIKTPISSAIFQIDSIIHAYEKDHSEGRLKYDLEKLNESLENTADLLSRLFSVQYFDTRSVTLYREKIQISHLLQNEFDLYSKMYPKTNFVNKIHSNLGYASVDRIQFHQVIINLLMNAIKFADSEYPSVLIEAQKADNEKIIISFEDN